MKQLFSKFKSATLMFMAAVLSFSLISPAITVYAANAATYQLDDNSIVADIVTSSTNGHTMPLKLWTYGGQVYVGIRSTHDMTNMVLAGVASTSAVSYPALDTITIGGNSYAPSDLSGNVDSAHWTVFTFPIASILANTTGVYIFSVTSTKVGKGHWIENGSLAVVIPTANVNITKNWVGGPKNPVSITLYRNIDGQAPVAVPSAEMPTGTTNPFTVSVDSPTYNIAGLPYTNSLGQIYEYSFQETHPGEGYTVTYGDAAAVYDSVNKVYNYSFSLTNTYTPPKISVTGTKVWVGGENSNGGVRPDVQLQLYRDGAVHGDVVTLQNGTTSYIWLNLDKTDASGKEYTYTVKEVGTPDNYIKTEEGLTVTNEYVIPTNGAATANKVWKNGPDTHPTVWFQLQRSIDGGTAAPVPGAEIKALPNGTTTVSWTGLEETDINGNSYTFSVKEVDANGNDFTPANYTKVESGLTVTNTYVIPTNGTANATKVWQGGESLGARPTVWFQLYRQINGGAEEKVNVPAVELLNGTTTVSWTGLEETDINGNSYTFSVKEVDVNGNDFTPVNYTKVESGLTVTNTYNSPLINVTANKDWVNGPAIKPAIWLQLYRNGEIMDGYKGEVIHPNTSYTWENLPKTDASGVNYTYTVKEVGAISNYEVTYGSDGLTVVNTYVSPKTEVSVTKAWEGGKARPDVTVNLLQDGTAIKTAILNTGNNWTASWSVDKTDSEGKDYVYTVEEVTVDGYKTAVGAPVIASDSTSFTITNTYVIPKVDISGTKVWAGGPEAKPTIQLQLYQGDNAFGDPVTLENGTVTHTWTDLDKTDFDGNIYKYTVKEVGSPDNYVVTYGEDGLTVTNTYQSPLINVTVNKVWEGGPATKPAIHLQLLRDGEVMEGYLQTVVSPNTTYTWNNLPKTDNLGQDYVYTVEEVSSPLNYSVSYGSDGLTVTNTYVSPKIDIAVSKAWDGGKQRPDVTVNLLRDGGVVETVTLNDANNWFASWTVDKTDFNGQEYVYTVQEVTVDGYTSTVSEVAGNSDQNFEIKNTYVIPKIDITGTKEWVGGPQVKPSIELELYRDGVLVDGSTITLENGQTSYTWKGVDETDFDGNAYVYTVKEVGSPVNYDVTYGDDGYTVTNTYVSPKIDYTVNKVWKDTFITHPDIDIQLYRDGEAYGDKITLGMGETSYTWTDLDETDGYGKKYVYTVDEVDVPQGYIKQVDGSTITNTYLEPGRGGVVLPETLAPTGDGFMLQMVAGLMMAVLGSYMLVGRRRAVEL